MNETGISQDMGLDFSLAFLFILIISVFVIRFIVLQTITRRMISQSSEAAINPSLLFKGFIFFLYFC